MLAQILRTDLKSRWLQAAVLSSLNDGAGEMFGLVAGDGNFRGTDSGREFLRQLLLIAGTKDQHPEVTQVLRDFQFIPEPQLAFSLALTLGNSLQRANDSLSAVDTGGLMKPIYANAGNAALNMNLDDPARTQALRLVGAVDSVDPGMTVGLLDEWPNLRAGLRREAVVSMLARINRTATLVYSVQTGDIAKTEFSPTQIKILLAYDDVSIHQSAVALFGNGGGGSRSGVVNRYLPALQYSGRAERGQQIFQAHCATCHTVAGQGNPIGLSLTDAARMSKEMLLTRILDPNRDKTSSYPQTLILTKDDEMLAGFIARQNTRSVTLCDANGAERTVGRSNNRMQKSLGFSGMPEGLEAGLNQQDMADLLEYITTNQ